MLTFNVILGYLRAAYSESSCDFFSFFFFNPTDPISGNAFDAEWKKKRDGLINQSNTKIFIAVDEIPPQND